MDRVYVPDALILMGSQCHHTSYDWTDRMSAPLRRNLTRQMVAQVCERLREKLNS
jgi:hypothetical protein